MAAARIVLSLGPLDPNGTNRPGPDRPTDKAQDPGPDNSPRSTHPDTAKISRSQTYTQANVVTITNNSTTYTQATAVSLFSKHRRNSPYCNTKTTVQTATPSNPARCAGSTKPRSQRVKSSLWPKLKDSQLSHHSTGLAHPQQGPGHSVLKKGDAANEGRTRRDRERTSLTDRPLQRHSQTEELKFSTAI